MGENRVGALRVELSAAVEKFAAGFARAVKIAQSGFRAIGKAGDRLASLGTKLSVGLTLPITAALGLITKAGGEFQSALKRAATEAEATGEDVDLLRQAAMEIGPAFQRGPIEAAAALEELAGRGLDARQAVATLPAVLALAKADNLELADAIDVVTGTLRAYRLRIRDAARVTDVIKASASAAGNSSKEFGADLEKLGPLATRLGLGFERTASMLVRLNQEGIKGKKAVSGLESLFERLATMSGPMAKTLAAAGISLRDQAGHLLPMEQILARLRPLAGDTGLMFKVFGDQAGLALSVLAQDGGTSLGAIEERLRSATGGVLRAAQESMGGFAGATARFSVSLETLRIKIAESGLLDAVTELVERMAGLIETASRSNPELLRLGVLTALVLAALGPLAVVVGTLASGFAQVGMLALSMAGGVAAFALAIAPAVIGLGALYVAWQGFSLALDSFLTGEGNAISTWFSQTFPEATEALGIFFDGLILNVEKMEAALTESVAALGRWKNDVLEAIGSTITEAGEWFGQKFQDLVVGPATSAVQKVKDAFAWLKDKVVANSEVPDMVEQVGVWMERLKDFMLPGAKAGTEAVLGLFRKLTAMAGPEIEKMISQVMGKLDELAPRVAAKGKTLATDPTTADSTIGDQKPAEEGESNFRRVGASAESAAEKSKQAWKSATDQMSRGIGDMVSKGEFSFKNLRAAAANVMQGLSSQFMQMALGGFGAKGKRSGLFGGLSNLFGFARGGSFSVGGTGGTDSQVVAFKASPRERVDITAPGQDVGPGGGVTLNQVLQISTGVAQQVRAEMMQMLPQVGKATQAGIADARLRGGRFSAAMGR